ncbi:hypothetical protein Vafri_13489 [Volvox africanus]|nr:hypothetical protein Vafri_13489 [Volvox africanus]
MSILTTPSHQQYSGQQQSRAWDAMPTPRFQTIKFLGRGAQGFVQLAYDNLHKERVAIKYIDRGWSRGFYKYVLRETLNHQQLSLCKHPHIVEFHEVFLTPSYLAVVMEYVNGTNLQHYLEGAGGKLPEDVARFIFQQLVIAVDFCHKKGKVNRDIKLANILLQEGHLPLVKLCDFGFSKDKFDDSEPQTQIGTALFTAPEIFTNVPGQVYDAEAADVWSCGVVLFVMLFGCHPFLSLEDTQQRKHAQVMKLIENAVRGNVQVPVGAEELYPQALDLVRHILVSAPSQRCKLPAIMAHPWFQDKLPPGALLLNAAYLSMEHPVGELRQTPEEVHSIITAALSASSQDEKSDCHSSSPAADMATISGPTAWQPHQHHQLQAQHQTPPPLHLQQLQPQATPGQPLSPMGSSTANPLGPQKGIMPHHHHPLQGSAPAVLQPPGHPQATSAAVQIHMQVPGQGQHPQGGPSRRSHLAQHVQHASMPHLTSLVQPSVVKPQQPNSMLLTSMDILGQQQHSGSTPTSSSSHVAGAVTGIGPVQPMQAAAVIVAPQHPVLSEQAAASFQNHRSQAVSNPTAQQSEPPPSSPMLISMDGSLGKNINADQLANTPGPAARSCEAAEPQRAAEMAVGGCVLYDSSLLYNLDLQTED